MVRDDPAGGRAGRRPPAGARREAPHAAPQTQVHAAAAPHQVRVLWGHDPPRRPRPFILPRSCLAKRSERTIIVELRPDCNSPLFGDGSIPYDNGIVFDTRYSMLALQVWFVQAISAGDIQKKIISPSIREYRKKLTGRPSILRYFASKIRIAGGASTLQFG